MTPQGLAIAGWLQDWIILSAGALLPIVLTGALILHFARPCARRQCLDAGARLGSDVSWLAYVLARDGVLLAAFVLSTVYLFPNVYLSQSLDIPITAPLSSLVLLWALVARIALDADESVSAFRAVSLLLIAGAALFVVPEALGVQAVNASYFWDEFGLGWVAPLLIAGQNPELATAILGSSLAAFAATAVAAFFALVRKGESLAAAREA